MKITLEKGMIIILIAFLGLGVQTVYGQRKIVASTNYITKKLNTSAFDRIRLSGSSIVEYTQSSNGETKVEIIAPDNVMDLLEVKVIEGTLLVGMKEDNISIEYINFTGKQKRPIIIASSPSLHEASLNGSGDIRLMNAIKAENLSLRLNGSGDINTQHDLTCSGNFEANLNGSGDIELNKLKAQKAALRVNGSGDIIATDIIASAGDINLMGSGDIETKGKCEVENLNVNLKGSGDIVVKGINSKEVRASLMGSGDISLAGKTQNADLNLKSSGEISATSLEAQNIQASTSGSGDINCYASKSLIAKANGSGEIGYKGNPVVTDNSPRKKKVRKL